MSHYKIDKELKENMSQRLRVECNNNLYVGEHIQFNYSRFIEDDYSEESGGKYWDSMD